MPRPVVNPTGSVPDPSQARFNLPSANPLPLSAGQEHQVREQYHANVRAICAEEIRRASFSPSCLLFYLEFLSPSVGLDMALWPYGCDATTAYTSLYCWACLQLGDGHRLMYMCIAGYAECARGRTFSMVWMCRQQQRAMNSCMVANATQEEQDRAREEWFRKRLEKAERAKRRKEREEEAAAAEAAGKK
ncbi:hypothetical protein Dda_0653 [Drechslerella dactyloides]|uniref:COX assembly mitochondrial protein n=1 Tax=Drechslerella dactyloides TaxID=74499 RepID=A0AAD6NM66_DREDA|nr:hypothetical protein Dda_0653 [Drechslerella dactyloides]